MYEIVIGCLLAILSGITRNAKATWLHNKR